MACRVSFRKTSTGPMGAVFKQSPLQMSFNLGNLFRKGAEGTIKSGTSHSVGPYKNQQQGATRCCAFIMFKCTSVIK